MTCWYHAFLGAPGAPPPPPPPPPASCTHGRCLPPVPHALCLRTAAYFRTVASSLEVVRPYCVVITTTPTFTYSLVQVPHKYGRTCPIGCYRPVLALCTALHHSHTHPCVTYSSYKTYHIFLSSECEINGRTSPLFLVTPYSLASYCITMRRASGGTRQHFMFYLKFGPYTA